MPAARSSDGPPMSICSTSSSNGVSGFCGRLRERIEVDDDEIDQLDALRLDRVEVVGPVAAGQDAAVNLRMQRLDPAVHHLGKPGDVGHVGDRQPGLGDGLRRAPGGDELDPSGGEAAGEVDQAVLSETLRIARIFGVFLDTFRDGGYYPIGAGGPAS